MVFTEPAPPMDSPSTATAPPDTASYPAAAYLNFCPGGISYTPDDDAWYDLASYSHTAASSPRAHTRRRVLSPDVLVAKAKAADDRLRQYVLLQDPTAPHFLPSLSVLAGEAFGRLTGVPPTAVRKWADAMVIQYHSNDPEVIPRTVQDIYDVKPTATSTTTDTTVSVLKSLLQPSEATRRPCGYVFKRGDIAWNCRTCQTDSTCVICDNCFRDSNHDGHEVYFHRTTPGGCCDCGDAEAWAADGCCSNHRPEVEVEESSQQDVEEAVRMAFKGQQDGLKTLKEGHTALPPKLAAALGVVIGAAVHCLVQAVDGAGIGADPIQWKKRWADEACRVLNGVCHDEEYYLKQPSVTLHMLLSEEPTAVSNSNRLHLRLHNDDVHTFEEVIEALHESRHMRRNDNPDQPLVMHREDANEMTHHVDADGQVTVKSFSTVESALEGYRRLKVRGLHCSVVSTAQVDMELRARHLTAWLSEICAAHPAAAVLVVHALVQVSSDHDLGGVQVWHEPHMIPAWAGLGDSDELTKCERRFRAFPPRLASSYVTRAEAERLYRMGMQLNAAQFVALTGTVPDFYTRVPYRLPSERYRKSPHALWGTLPSTYSDTRPPGEKHPLLYHLATGQVDLTMRNRLSERIVVVDTDLRKQQEADRIISSVYAHKLPGLHMISGVGSIPLGMIDSSPPPLPNPMQWRHLLETSSFRAPVSPVVLLLLLDPYPTKQLRAVLHALFLSLLIDARFKCRFAAALGAIAYRPLSTLFCAGVGTDADTPLGFTVQIFTAGSLIRALGNASATEKLLLSDDENEEPEDGAPVGIFTLPIGHSVVRCIQTNLLGATKEVHMILNNTAAGNDDDSQEAAGSNDSLLPSLTYLAGEHPLITALPAAPDDGFLDSRSTRHKRLPHLLRDLEYIIETPGTAIRLLLPNIFPVHPALLTNSRADELLSFAAVWARLLRTAQGMDPQKRKISGGHVEYEQNRWLEAFGLSLNLAGTRDALAESLTNSSSSTLAPISADGSHLAPIHQAMGNLFTALLRELKLWLYREGMLETGLPIPPGGTHGGLDLLQVETLQRSTLHVSSSQFESPSAENSSAIGSSPSAVALSCATGVKMTESQLELIENALRMEGMQRQHRTSSDGGIPVERDVALNAAAMGDWLRVPHSPLAGDSLSFHLPLHRALAKSVRSICNVVVPEVVRMANPSNWWKLPVMDDDFSAPSSSSTGMGNQHPLAALVRSCLRSSNCRVVWSAGPDCSPSEASKRRSRAKTVSANIASAKIIHSLADHPLRCLAAAQQIERHLWARNGSSTAGMALNYSSAPLCRSFRDLDLTLVQLSASGLSIGLGARRVFSLLISRFSMDGYLCDPERRIQGSPSSPSSGGYGSGHGGWVNPPRMQDPDHAAALSESFFATMCILVTELPPPPPTSPSDNMSSKQSMRRELLHALAAEPRSYSEAMEAATSAISRRDENIGIAGGGGVLGDIFAEVLRDIGKQKSQGSSRSGSGPAAFELRAECCDEYDPTFFHLRRQEHQHAMDTVARLRRQKMSENGAADAIALPVVCPPPKAHPRFLPCRLLLHLQPMDAAIRRSLLFALTGGSWLPPAEQISPSEDKSDDGSGSEGGETGISTSTANPFLGVGDRGSVPVTTYGRRAFGRSSSSVGRRSFSETGDPQPFSPSVVASSSVSFLEILQLLTLQVHTLEECASLHRTQQELDGETKLVSASLSINSYLGRLIHVPESLVDEWSLKPYPDGPLPSRGSGANRGSILGLLIALYEHRSDSGIEDSSKGLSDSGHGDEGHGGARALAASGKKWLLRFVNALVDGAPSVGAAAKSATSGVPVRGKVNSSSLMSDWTLDPTICTTVRGMLSNLSELWPKENSEMSSEPGEKSNDKGREARKAAQARVMEMMKKKQEAFVKTLTPAESGTEVSGDKLVDGDDPDLCIICRCDDADGENNGPLGYLGHVQRSRAAQIRASTEAFASTPAARSSADLYKTYRVVGHRGCQLRATKAMNSEQLVCLPTGSIVTVTESTVSDKYDILSRRVLVRHAVKDPVSGVEKVAEGWASVQSSEGYVILSPLSSLCYANTRWGSTRPVIRQCGHAAHSKCVEHYVLSLHSRAAGDQPYDGRFAANIDDGEYLCPLCKQLSNILIPRDGCARVTADPSSATEERKKTTQPTSKELQDAQLPHSARLRQCLTRKWGRESDEINEKGRLALEEFGAHLYQAMHVPWERSTSIKKRKQRLWDPAIQRWDYEEQEDDDDDDDDDDSMASSTPCLKTILRLLRQQHIAWASIGHSSAAAEAGSRGVEKVLPFGVFAETSDPWTDYSAKARDSHPMLLELRRTMSAAAGLLEVLDFETKKSSGQTNVAGAVYVVGSCLSSIIEGRSWDLQIPSVSDGEESVRDFFFQWSQLTALMSSMPCHVARDGMLSQRHEARATAAAMWTIKGTGTRSSEDGDASFSEPPVPFAIRQVHALSPGISEIPDQWGTMEPYLSAPKMDEKYTTLNTDAIPFRPGVASAFLYTPLLAWDLNTLAGAIYSTMLANDVDGPTATDLLLAARLLLFGRVVQVIITPCGYEPSSDADDDDALDFWTQEQLQTEKAALATLLSHCRKAITSRPFSAKAISNAKVEDEHAFSAVGSAILPFARSLILLLRAASSTLRLRRRNRSNEGGGDSGSQDDEILETLLDDPEIMSCEDGFFVLKEMGGPLPSQIEIESESSFDGDSWWSLMNRWLHSVVELELHHGSRGRSIASTNVSASGGENSSWMMVNPDNNNAAAEISSLADTHQLKLNDPRGHLEEAIAMLHAERAELETTMHLDTTRGRPAPIQGELGEDEVNRGNDAHNPGEMNDEDMEEVDNPDRNEIRMIINQHIHMDDELADSEDDMMEIDDGEEEMVAFAEQALGVGRAPLTHHPLHPTTSDVLDDTSDDNSNASSSVMTAKERILDDKFAGVSRSPIIPYQPSLLGIASIGPGKRGSPFDIASASKVMHDLSHLGMIHRRGTPTRSLIRLPKSFVELYGLVNRVKGRDESAAVDDADDASSPETAICLLTGTVMKSGSPRRAYARTARPPGSCTIHARQVGSGTGIFFLVQKCTVLLMHNNKSAYSPSLYVDQHGEEDPGLRRGRPLFLNEARYRALEMLWRQQGIPREVAQIRSTSDRVIRDNWY